MPDSSKQIIYCMPEGEECGDSCFIWEIEVHEQFMKNPKTISVEWNAQELNVRG